MQPVLTEVADVGHRLLRALKRALDIKPHQLRATARSPARAPARSLPASRRQSGPRVQSL